MFRVLRHGEKKSVYEVASIDRAIILAGELSRFMARTMEEKDCWVEIRDARNVMVKSINAFKPGQSLGG